LGEGQAVRVVEVDGETFKVEEASGDPRQLNFCWLTGPNPGYGFASGGHQPGLLGSIEASVVLEPEIREFLSQINPATGYL